MRHSVALLDHGCGSIVPGVCFIHASRVCPGPATSPC